MRARGIINNSLDDLVDIFHDTITSILDQFIPQRTKSFHVQPSNVWFDDDCRTAERLMRFKERRYKRYNQLIKQRGFNSSILIIRYVMSSVVGSESVKLPATQGIRRSSRIKLTTFWVEQNGLRNQNMLLIHLPTFS